MNGKYYIIGDDLSVEADAPTPEQIEKLEKYYKQFEEICGIEHTENEDERQKRFAQDFAEYNLKLEKAMERLRESSDSFATRAEE